MSRALTGTLLVLLSAGAYGFLPIFAKLAFRELDPLDVLMWRFVIATMLLWLLAPAWRRQANLRTLTRRDVLMLLGMGALFSVVALLSFVGLSYLPVSIYISLFYTYPAMVALLSLALGERLPISAWLAVGLAVVGCALTAFTPDQQTLSFSLLDLWYPILAAAVYAVYLVLAARRTKHISGLTSGVLSISGTMVVLLAANVVAGPDAPATPMGWLMVGGLAVVSTVLAIIAMFMGITRIGAPRASIISTLEPVTAVALAALILGERPGWPQLAGGALVVVSVVILNLPSEIGEQGLEVRG